MSAYAWVEAICAAAGVSHFAVGIFHAVNGARFRRLLARGVRRQLADPPTTPAQWQPRRRA